MPIKKVFCDQLAIGMYVASLDRPWTETPFLFQGFELHTQQDIDELCRHARYAYVIVPDEEIELTRKGSGRAETNRTSTIFHQTTYVDSVPVDREISEARPSQEMFGELFAEVESLVRVGRPVSFEIFQQPAKNLVNSITRNPDAYIWLTRLKKFDSYLYKDSLTAAVWATALGRKLGIAEQELQNLAIGCLLMDIGKLRLPTAVQHKTGRLSHEEWETMKSHVELGVKLLAESADYPPEVLNIVRTHHERLDGCGYPDGLTGGHIPLFGQIAGIVDQYVAVTRPRPFADAISPSKAEEMLYKQRGKLFDEMLVEYFIQALSAYPTGSLVELSSGEVAIVQSQNSGRNLRPNVILLLDPSKQPYGVYPLVNLDTYSKDDLPVRIVRTLAVGEYGIDIEELPI